MNQMYHITVNDTQHEIACEPDRLLIDVLREDLRLTGTKNGCGVGVCGSCTVLIDGQPKRACRVKMKDVAGTKHEGRPIPSGSRTKDEGQKSTCVHRPSEHCSRTPIVPANNVSDRPSSITTIEGLERNGKLHPIQQAFIDCGAIQCGFCTPGMVLSAKALIDANPSPTREEIKRALKGNLCRCTGYQQIFEAVEEAAKRMKENPDNQQ